MSHQVELTHDSFSEFVRANRFALIHFWATWNGHDQKQREMIDSEMPDDIVAQVAFGRLEVDPIENYPIVAQHQLRNIPTFAFYHSGSLVRLKVGAQYADVLTEDLRELIGPKAGESNEAKRI